MQPTSTQTITSFFTALPFARGTKREAKLWHGTKLHISANQEGHLDYTRPWQHFQTKSHTCCRRRSSQFQRPINSSKRLHSISASYFPYSSTRHSISSFFHSTSNVRRNGSNEPWHLCNIRISIPIPGATHFVHLFSRLTLHFGACCPGLRLG